MIADASNFVGTVNGAFIFIVSICVFFLVLITTLMITFIVKYSRKKNKKATNYHGNVLLEVTWTVIPTLLVLVMFWIGWTGYKEMVTIPKDAMVVDIYAQMWRWQFQYENGVKSDTFYVPLNKPVKVNLHSKDVNHSFYVASFRVKKDVIPNRTNTAWFTAEELGEYSIECAEYCGMNHSYMRSIVSVLPQTNFNFWLENTARKDSASGGNVAAADSGNVSPQDSVSADSSN